MKYPSSFIFLLLFFFSCTSKDLNEDIYIPEGTLMRINSYTVPCEGIIEMNCLLVQIGNQIGTDQWDYFYDSIEGFEYEEGFQYDLDVLIKAIDNPPADASSIRYQLIRLIRKF
ncbi:MAG: DUF4377 domain-containing protein [Flavobacteriaceae bacterium]